MSSYTDQSESTVSDGVLRIVREKFRESVTLKVALLGAILLVLGYLMNLFFGMSPAAEFQTRSYDLWGLWAAIFAVWGGSLLIVGLLSFVVIYWKRR